MMFLNLLNRIFGPKSSLSREEIDAYKKAKGNLHAIEEKAAHSSFDNEALEGWQKANYSVSEGMETVDHKMNEFEKSTPSPLKKGKIITIALLVAACFLFVIITYIGNQNAENQENTEIVQTTAKENKFKTDLDKISTYKAITQKKQITASQLENKKKLLFIPPQKENRIDVSTKKNAELADSTSSIHLPIQEKSALPSPSADDQLAYHQAKEVYIHGLKNVDYRAYRSRPIITHNSILEGVPANQENSSMNKKEKKSAAYASAQKSIPYIDYLTQSDYYFNQGDFKMALKHYLIILKTYPEDVNANFYGGLCYYNLGQFERSIQLFKKSYSIGYGNFRQEAYWFIAKANNEQGKKLKTKYYLKKIIQEGGFYSIRAKEMLKKVEAK